MNVDAWRAVAERTAAGQVQQALATQSIESDISVAPQGTEVRLLRYSAADEFGSRQAPAQFRARRALARLTQDIPT